MAYSLWCSMRSGDDARFRSVITALSEAQGGRSFQPHITLGSFQALPDLPAYCDRGGPLELRPSALDATGDFTTSLFVRLSMSQRLMALRARLEQDPAFRAGRRFDPHISLCYGPPPHGSLTRGEVQSLLKQLVVFDRLTLIELSLPVRTYDDVANWKVIAEQSLG